MNKYECFLRCDEKVGDFWREDLSAGSVVVEAPSKRDAVRIAPKVMRQSRDCSSLSNLRVVNARRF